MKTTLRRVQAGLYIAKGGKIHVALRGRACNQPEGWYVEWTSFFGAPQRRVFSTLALARAFVAKLLGEG